MNFYKTFVAFHEKTNIGLFGFLSEKEAWEHVDRILSGAPESDQGDAVPPTKKEEWRVLPFPGYYEWVKERQENEEAVKRIA